MSIVVSGQAQRGAQKKKGRGKKNRGTKDVVNINLSNAPSGKKRRNRRKTPGGNMSSNRGAIKVHPCTNKFAEALSNPWATWSLPGDVCIPDDTDTPSFKFRVRLRGTFGTNSDFGCVMVSPIALANGALDSVLYTNATSSSTVVPPAGAPGTGTFYLKSNSPFSSATGATMPLIRPVVVGVRVRYIGTELTRGGSILPYRSRYILSSSTTGLSFSKIATLGQSNVQPVKRKWVGTVWTPIRTSDANYVVAGSQHDIASAFSRSIGVAVSAPGTPVTYEYDICAYYEAIGYADGSGNNYQPPDLSPSDSDVDGYSFVKDIYASLADSAIGQLTWNALKAGAVSYLKAQVPFGTAVPPAIMEL